MAKNYTKQDAEKKFKDLDKLMEKLSQLDANYLVKDMPRSKYLKERLKLKKQFNKIGAR